MTAPMTTAESLTSASDTAFAEEFGIPTELMDARVGGEAGEPEVVDEVAAAEIADAVTGDETPGAETPAEVEAPADETPAVETPAEPRAQITEFSVFDNEGELEIPELMIEYKAMGVSHRESLDKVVRLAQYGKYNEALVTERDGLKVASGQMEEALAQREAVITAREEQIERLLVDDEFLLQARDAYENFNNPEMRASRAEQQLASDRATAAQEKQDAQMFDFVGTRLVPAYEAMLAKYPTVPADEMWGRFSKLTAPLQVKGEIPKAKWGTVEKMLTDDIAPWAAQLHESRTSTARQKTEESSTAVRKAQEETTRAKKTLSRATKPVGGTPATPGKPRQIASADDAIADIHAMLDGM